MNVSEIILGRNFNDLLAYSTEISLEIKDKNIKKLKTRIDMLYGYHVIDGSSVRGVSSTLLIYFFLMMASVLFSPFGLIDVVNEKKAIFAYEVMLIALLPYLIPIICTIRGNLLGLNAIASCTAACFVLVLASLMFLTFDFFADYEVNLSVYKSTVASVFFIILSRMYINSKLINKLFYWTVNTQMNKKYHQLRANYKS